MINGPFGLCHAKMHWLLKKIYNKKQLGEEIDFHSDLLVKLDNVLSVPEAYLSNPRSIALLLYRMQLIFMPWVG